MGFKSMNIKWPVLSVYAFISHKPSIYFKSKSGKIRRVKSTTWKNHPANCGQIGALGATECALKNNNNGVMIVERVAIRRGER